MPADPGVLTVRFKVNLPALPYDHGLGGIGHRDRRRLVPTMTRTLTVLIDRQGIHQSAGRLSVGTKGSREDGATVTSFETESGRPVGPRGCSHGRR